MPGRSPLSLAPWQKSSIFLGVPPPMSSPCPLIRRSALRSAATSTGQARREREGPLAKSGAGCEQQGSDLTPVAAVDGDPEGPLGTAIGQRGAAGLRQPLCVGLARRRQGAWTAALSPGPVGRDDTYNNSNCCGRNFLGTSWTCRVSSVPACGTLRSADCSSWRLQGFVSGHATSPGLAG